MDDENRQHLKTVRQAHVRRLHTLEEQAAISGRDTRPEIIIEIQDLRVKITEIDQQLGTPIATFIGNRGDSYSQPIITEVQLSSLQKATSPRLSNSPNYDQQQIQLKVQNQLKAGANWFFLIGILSILNSFIVLVGGHLNFAVGLGITQFIDGIAQVVATKSEGNNDGLIQVIGFIIDVIIAGLFILLGFRAKKGYRISFVVGMLFYIFDGLILVLLGIWLSAGLHLFVLFGL